MLAAYCYRHRRTLAEVCADGLVTCRDRVQNLYFAYLFVLRAVMKAAPVLTSYQYDTGLVQEDQKTQQLITELVRAV